MYTSKKQGWFNKNVNTYVENAVLVPSQDTTIDCSRCNAYKTDKTPEQRDQPNQPNEANRCYITPNDFSIAKTMLTPSALSELRVYQ